MSHADSAKRSRSTAVGCLTLVLVAVAAAGTWVWRGSLRGWTVAKLEALIEAEVPRGCDRQHVEAWFKRHRIQHLYFAHTTGDRRGPYTMPMLAGLRDRDLSGMIRGTISWPEANMGFGRNGDIMVYFFFDTQGRCVGHLVHPFVVSL
jgi:hypothetical protein